MEMIYFLAVFLLLFWVYSKRLRTPNKTLPPAPPALPIIGHLHLLKPPYHRSLQSLSERYGPILFLRLGRQPFLIVSSPSAVQDCFTQNDIIFASRPKFMSGRILGNDYSNLVWAPYGPLWRNLRRVATIDALSSHRIQKTAHTRQGEIRFMIRQLLQRSEINRKVDLNSFLSELTHNLIMTIINGRRWDGSTDNLFPPAISINVCDLFPVLRWVGFKGTEKKMVQLKNMRDVFLQGLIDECLREKAKSPSRGGTSGGAGERKKTLVEELVALQEDEPDRYTDDVLKGLLLVILAAGTDTTARTMEWTMSLLLNHPHILQKARDEIDTAVGGCRLIEDSDITKLSYLQCIVNEALRLFPVAPLLVPHFSSEDCTVGGYHVSKGTVLLVNAWALHRSPNLWQDPTEFRPERFIGAVEGEGEGFKFIPFGMGRRACPGSNLGMKTVTLTLASLIQCFDWERVDGELVDMEEGTGLTLPKKKPLEAMCTPRSSMITVLCQL
ncbi:hypothetical protein Nepgr_018506 [Nepenthes gracilis]|uniref:Cytochrome P450 n=1 Tax=Nepenthes gracilis TaxID=150966 RepID=A0AAD3XUC0_NEPGR|nr:hypothetical protein Nepgr_018506 [Nepenthes gracilis]